MRRFTTSGGVTAGRGSGTQAPFWAAARPNKNKVKTVFKPIFDGKCQTEGNTVRSGKGKAERKEEIESYNCAKKNKI
jgi:hypothetical protein